MIRIPALFIGHGSPMNALETNPITLGWRALGVVLPKPVAVLCISAHWLTRGLAVTAMPNPRTIHDFGGFPQVLFDVQYRAPGSPALATRVRELLTPLPVAMDAEWGLDHGAWSVLVHLLPDADVPVVQFSLDATQPASFHYAIGQKLAVLRDEGVLILGSGNVVHNLRRLQWQGAAAYDWALRFEGFVRHAIETRDHAALIDWKSQGADAALAVPTPEHYWPLLPVLGAQMPDEQAAILLDGIEMASISLLSLKVG